MFFFDLFCGGIVSCFSAETRWTPMLGVSEIPGETPEHANVGGIRNSGWDPRTQEKGIQTHSSTLMTQEETKNLLKNAQASKVVSPFTRALAPPFIGRRRDFYISKIPSNQKNIPNVNTYMNVFYISYIYKPATSSHVKPGLLRQRLGLGFLLFVNLLFIGTFTRYNLRTWSSVDFRFSHIPIPDCDFGTLQVQDSWSLQIRDFEASHVQGSRSSQVHDFRASQVQDSRSSQVRNFRASQVQGSRSLQVRDFRASQVQDSRSS
jgi:hypothetical protein